MCRQSKPFPWRLLYLNLLEFPASRHCYLKEPGKGEPTNPDISYLAAAGGRCCTATIFAASHTALNTPAARHYCAVLQQVGLSCRNHLVPICACLKPRFLREGKACKEGVPSQQVSPKLRLPAILVWCQAAQDKVSSLQQIAVSISTKPQ